jgi:hypothetical protein
MPQVLEVLFVICLGGMCLLLLALFLYALAALALLLRPGVREWWSEMSKSPRN